MRELGAKNCEIQEIFLGATQQKWIEIVRTVKYPP